MGSSDDASPFHIELDLRTLPAKRTQANHPTVTRRTFFDDEDALGVLAAARHFASDPDRVMRLYVEDPATWGGAYLSGDELLRMLPCRPQHPWLSYALGGQFLATMVRGLFTRRLALPQQPGERVLLTMGMPGSGKTTLVKAGFGKRFFAVVDTPLGNFDLARELIRETQATGRSVSLVLAWRPLDEAVSGMLDRAMPGHEERAVPLLDMQEILLKVSQVFLDLAELNPFDGDVTLDVVRCESGARTWCAGDAGAAFLAAEREKLLALPGCILAHFVRAWLQALRFHEFKGAVVPELLRAVAEDGVDLARYASDPLAPAPSAVAPGQRTLPRGVKSLVHLPGWLDVLMDDLRSADRYEEGLRDH
jgi:hypothetical protein